MKKVESTLYPDVILGGHVGPLDLAFYTGKMFPAKYQGGMFVALHGSWNRSQRQGYKIAFIPFRDRMATAGPEDFVSGWMLAPDKKEVWQASLQRRTAISLEELDEGAVDSEWFARVLNGLGEERWQRVAAMAKFASSDAEHERAVRSAETMLGRASPGAAHRASAEQRKDGA